MGHLAEIFFYLSFFLPLTTVQNVFLMSKLQQSPFQLEHRGNVKQGETLQKKKRNFSGISMQSLDNLPLTSFPLENKILNYLSYYNKVSISRSLTEFLVDIPHIYLYIKIIVSFFPMSLDICKQNYTINNIVCLLHIILRFIQFLISTIV